MPVEKSAPEEKKIRIVSPPGILSFKSGGVIFFHPGHSTWLKTSCVGQWILERLMERPGSVEEMVSGVAAYYDLPEHRVRGSVDQFITSLVENGFAGADGENPPGTGHADHADDGDRADRADDADSDVLRELWIGVASDGASSGDRPIHGGGKRACIPLEAFEQIIREAAGMKISSVHITGGEPLIHPDLPEVLRYVRRAGDWRVVLLTHGLVDGRVAPVDGLGDLVDEIIVFTDSASLGDNPFLQRLGTGELSGKTGVCLTPSPRTLDEIAALPGLMSQLHGGRAYLDHACMSGRRGLGRGGAEIDLSSRPASYRKCLKRWREVKKKVTLARLKGWKRSPERARNLENVVFSSSFEPYTWLLRESGTGMCGAGRQRLFIGEDGVAFPCQALCEDDACDLGNALSEGLSELHRKGIDWHNRSSCLDGDRRCRECHFSLFCGGGCRAEGDPGRRDPRCDVFLEFFHDFLEQVVSLKSIAGQNES